MNYLLTTDRQTVNYYLTIHALKLTYFHSNTQETMKKQLYPSDSSNFPLLHWKKPTKTWSVTQAFTFIAYVYNAQKMTLHRLTSRRHSRWESYDKLYVDGKLYDPDDRERVDQANPATRAATEKSNSSGWRKHSRQ